MKTRIIIDQDNWSECTCNECGYTWQAVDDEHFNFTLCNSCFSTDIGGVYWSWRYSKLEKLDMKPKNLFKLLLLNMRVPIIKLVRILKKILRALRKSNRRNRRNPKF